MFRKGKGIRKRTLCCLKTNFRNAKKSWMEIAFWTCSSWNDMYDSSNSMTHKNSYWTVKILSTSSTRAVHKKHLIFMRFNVNTGGTRKTNLRGLEPDFNNTFYGADLDVTGTAITIWTTTQVIITIWIYHTKFWHCEYKNVLKYTSTWVHVARLLEKDFTLATRIEFFCFLVTVIMPDSFLDVLAPALKLRYLNAETTYRAYCSCHLLSLPRCLSHFFLFFAILKY